MDHVIAWKANVAKQTWQGYFSVFKAGGHIKTTEVTWLSIKASWAIQFRAAASIESSF